MKHKDRNVFEYTKKYFKKLSTFHVERPQTKIPRRNGGSIKSYIIRTKTRNKEGGVV
jgi:hypothetical protein